MVEQPSFSSHLHGEWRAACRKFGLVEPIYDMTPWAKSGVALEGTGEKEQKQKLLVGIPPQKIDIR